MAGVRHQGVLVGLLASVMLLVGTIRPLLAETLPTPLSEEGAAPSVRPTARVQNPVSELASGLRSLFNLDKQPDARPPPPGSARRNGPKSTRSARTFPACIKWSAILCRLDRMVAA